MKKQASLSVRQSAACYIEDTVARVEREAEAQQNGRCLQFARHYRQVAKELKRVAKDLVRKH